MLSRISIVTLLLLAGLLGFSEVNAESPASQDIPQTQINPASMPITDPSAIRQQFITISQRPQYAQLDDEDMNSNFQNWLSWALIQLNNRWSHFKYAKEMQSLSYMLNSMFVVISFIALITLFRRLVRRKPKTRRNRSAPAKLIPNLDALAQLDREIAEAEQVRNWTAAFSASWRQLILRLQIQRIIPADPSQTNAEYLDHLKLHGIHPQQTQAFHSLVQTFDRTFYGQMGVTPEEWGPIKKSIQQTAQLFSRSTGAPQ